MGLTRQYLRYVPGSVFGVVASVKSNIAFVELRAQVGRYVAAGACENVIVWDSRTSEKILTLIGEKSCVSTLKTSPSGDRLAVGYDDGVVRLFDLMSGECLVTLNGHKSSVTCLNFDSDGMRLVSGSQDTNIVIWDIVAEAGLYRFSGHKGPITNCCFLETKNVLISSSRDTLVKFWDLDTQHCFKTLVGHRSEVWDMVLLKDDKLLVTGCGDSELRVWEISDSANNESEKEESLESKRQKTDTEAGDDLEGEYGILTCTKLGTILRQGRDRVVNLATDPERNILACHGMDSTVELFRIHGEEEVKQRFGKRQRKEKKKCSESPDESVSLQDRISRINSVRASSKVKALDVQLDAKGLLRILVLMGNNAFELHQVDLKDNKSESSLTTKLMIPGHRSDVRALSISADNIAIASASGESLKIWNRNSQVCIRTMNCEYALSILFAPGDRHIIIATKTGKLQIFDIASGRLLEQIEAHEGEIWSVHLSPDLRGIASGGADKQVKFWQFELIRDDVDNTNAKRLSLVHTRTLKLEEDVLCVRFSPDMRLIAVSLLDSTVKVFFVDSLKFFLSLYGHKFPVLCMDISYDSTLIITAGADKNIKIWGLDFGDCHRSIFAHEDSIMGLQFVSKTHLFFSCSKDGKLKQWDADHFENVVTLEGHHSQIWTLAVSADGRFVASSSHDRSIRLWERTQEPLVLEDERETEREADADKALVTGEERIIPGHSSAKDEASLPGRKTADTERAAERIMEAIEVHKEVSEQLEEYREKLDHHKKNGGDNRSAPVPPQANPHMIAYNTQDPDKYVVQVLRQVKSSELEECLIVLPFHYVQSLMNLMDSLLRKGFDTELLTRILLFLVRLHHGPLSNAPALLPVLNKLRDVTKSRVDKARDCVGFNLAALHQLQCELNEKEAVQLFADASDKVKQKRKQQRRKEKSVHRAILSL